MDIVSVPLRNFAVSASVVTTASFWSAYRSPVFLVGFTYYGCVGLVWFLHVAVWAFWRILIKPNFFSDFRQLPEPKVGTSTRVARKNIRYRGGPRTSSCTDESGLQKGRNWWNGYVHEAFFGMKGLAISRW